MSKEPMTNEAKNIQAKLLKNPKYDSDWIGVATTIIANGYMGEVACSLYNSNQLIIIQDLFENKDNIAEFEEIRNIIMAPELNATQMRILLSAALKGVTAVILKKFSSPELPYEKTNYLLEAAGTDKVDMSDYINYDADQIYEIFCGIRTGINYEIYAHKAISAEKMGIARHALDVGCQVSVLKSSEDGEIVLTIK